MSLKMCHLPSRQQNYLSATFVPARRKKNLCAPVGPETSRNVVRGERTFCMPLLLLSVRDYTQFQNVARDEQGGSHVIRGVDELGSANRVRGRVAANFGHLDT